MNTPERVAGFEMVPPSGRGRSFRAVRRVRLGDASPQGRLRLDALARYLHDVANDDSRDAAWSDPHWWVVRRTVVDVRDFPVYLQEIALTTWCGGTGSHWAERRTRIESLDGAVLADAASLWVHVDSTTLAPSRVPDDVAHVLGESSAGRKVNARLLLGRDDEAPLGRTRDTGAFGWPLRFADFDVVGHLNNAAYWEALEEVLAGVRSLRAPLRAVMEHVAQVEPGGRLDVSWIGDDTERRLTLVENGDVRAEAWAGPLPG